MNRFQVLRTHLIVGLPPSIFVHVIDSNPGRIDLPFLLLWENNTFSNKA